MIRVGLVLSVILTITVISGCNKTGDNSKVLISANEVVQQSDGNILLDIEDAYLLSDKEHPARNTAEWQFEVISRGRYEVWLSSITKDTMDLHYDNPVIVTFENKRISEKPVGNEIVLDDREVNQPFYRADSKLGSIYIEDPGHYNIQVITDKLLPDSGSVNSDIQNHHTIVKSLILKPLKP